MTNKELEEIEMPEEPMVAKTEQVDVETEDMEDEVEDIKASEPVIQPSTNDDKRAMLVKRMLTKSEMSQIKSNL